MQSLGIIFRSILKGKFYSLVSVLGLAVALSGVILVAGLIRHETSFESQYDKADQIYRLTWQNPDTGDEFATMFNPFSPQMVIDFPEVTEAARITTTKLKFERQGEGGNEGFSNLEDLAFADPSFFSVFNFNFVEGNPESVLNDPGSLVLTRAGAAKYFGDADPMGQTLLLEDDVTLTVRGIIEDMPKTTHFSFHFIVPLETLRPIYGGAQFLDNWGSDVIYHYIVLEDGTVPEAIEAQLPAFALRHSGFDDFDVNIYLQPLKDIHFANHLQDEVPYIDSILNITKAPRKRADLLLFGVGALILVLVASFNFMNLQVARGVGKNKQMGILRVYGGTRKKVFQFVLAESIALSLVGLVLATALLEISLQGFGALLGLSFTWSEILSPAMIAFVLILTIGLGVASGLYPAFLMASQVPAKVLKGEFSMGQGAHRVRHGLVLLQFAVSTILIIVSFGIYSQIQFSLERPLGFEAENTTVLEANRGDIRRTFPVLKEQLLSHPDIVYVSRGSVTPPGNLSDGSSFVPEGGDPNNPVAVRRVGVDYDYFEALGIEMLAGRTFNENFPNDVFEFPSEENPNTTGGVILNRTAALRAGWATPEEAIGKQTTSQFDIGFGPVSVTLTVVGIAPDVHYRSLRSEVTPMGFMLSQENRAIVVKYAEGDTAKAKAHLEAVWAEVLPETPLAATLLTERVTQLYAQERNTLNLVSSISLLAIFVAALGLFAVATLVSEKRTKEVGLRKVLGAKVRQIVNLLSWQFLKPVLLANLLAWPVAWYFLNDWLQAFVFRFDLTFVYFLTPALVVLSVAWGTVAGQAYKVARANPIKALRYE